MKKSSREALDAYYREAGSWAADQIGTLRLSRRVAWIVAAVAAVIAIVEGLALIVLMPLKTTVPYTLMVDRTTGFVQALKPLDPAQITPDRALVQSMLVQYVIAREGFDMGSLQADYGKVGLWSAGTARTEYLALMQASNTSSPLNLYPASTLVETRVKSVSPLNSSSALVRFETIRRDEGGQPHSALPWVAIIEYRFSGEPMATEDRFLNPLGFQVTGYRRDAEALAPAPLPSITQEAAAPANDLPQAGAMIRLCATLLALSIAGSAAGRTMPALAPPADPRIQTVPYDAGRVFPLRVAPRHQLALIFGPEERVENVAIGDSEAWQITPSNRGDSLFIKPLRASGVTNMTVITDAHVYSFELTPASGPGLDAPYTIRFTYPGAATSDQTVPAAVPGIGRYRLSGARGVRPQALDDDGLRTYIEWKPNAPVPAVFAIDERDAETLLQGQMRDGRFVIDAVYRNLVFRLDGQTARAARLTPRGDRR